ncbi:MAG: hypothetical protein U0237_09785 [Thermoleophilia bacterium]
MTVVALPQSSELSRISALLDRLDPQPTGECTVPGCLHLHGDGGAHDLPAAA